MSEKRNQSFAESAIKEFVISRTFDAPREVVWKAWTEPESMKQWWGPKDSQVLQIKMDFRVGGVNHYAFSYANQEMWGKMVYREIKAPERIVWVNSFSDEKGGVTRHPMSPTWPIEMLTTLTLTEHQGKTTVTIHWLPLNPNEEERKTFDAGHGSMRQGWTGTFDRLAGSLENPPIVIERTFDAPIQKVWKAITDRDQMKKWYFDLKEFKAEVGFEFQILSGCHGRDYLHLCKITEVTPDKKLTHSWRYDGYEGISFVTWELFPEGNKTRLKLTHTGLETFPKSNPDFAKENFVEGWTSIIGTSLQTFLEK